MQLYPAILITPDDRFDGLQLMELPDGDLRIRSGSGNIYGLLQPWQAIPIPAEAAGGEPGGPGWLIRGVLTGGEAQALDREVVWAVVKSSRTCGCGGPRRSPPTDADQALLSSWDQLAEADGVQVRGSAG